MPAPMEAVWPRSCSTSMALTASMYFATVNSAALAASTIDMTVPLGVKPSAICPATAKTAIIAVITTAGQASATIIDQF